MATDSTSQASSSPSDSAATPGGEAASSKNGAKELQEQQDEDELLRNLTASLDIGVLFLDLDLRVTHFTPRVRNLFNLESEDVGEPLSRVARRIDDQLFDDARKVLSTEESVQREVESETGEWFVMRVLPYRANDEDRLQGVVVTFFDISDRKQMEDRLRESEGRLQLLMENVNEYAIFILDEDGKITSWNEASERIFQYGEYEVMGRPNSILYTADDRSADVPVAHREEALETGQAMDYRWMIRKDGSRFWAYGLTVALYDTDDQLRGFGRVVRDTSDRKRSEEKLARAKEESDLAQQEAEEARERAERAKMEAEHASETKSQFLANMSHELRTPLNAIIGYSDMMKEDAGEMGEDKFVEDLDRILNSGRHLLSLVNDVLDLSKVEAGRMDLDLRDFEVEPIIEEATDTVRPVIEGNDSELVIEIGDEVGPMHADPTKIKQSINNLLSNAAKFTEDGAVTLRVHTERRDGTEGLAFEVEDTGIGMTDEEQENLFEAFEQASEETSTEYGGTGLGLAITNNLCQLMGGAIDAESEKGVGTTFTMWLPARVNEDEAERKASAVRTKASRSDSSPSSSSGTVSAPAKNRSNTVLVIDDDPDVRELVKRHLSSEGFRVKTAASGAEGLHLAQRIDPFVITLDVKMPDMDGFEVLTHLKQDDDLADVPVIMLSIADKGERGYRLGASDFLVKPVNRDRLTNVLDKYRPDTGTASILIVEDDADARDMTSRAVEKVGHSVALAVNGREAVDKLDEVEPDLILLDLMMPEMDGFEFLDHLRRDEDHRDTPVVVLTAKELTPEDRRRLSGQVDKTLQKSEYSRDKLLGEVRERVRSVQAEHEADEDVIGETPTEAKDSDETNDHPETVAPEDAEQVLAEVQKDGADDDKNVAPQHASAPEEQPDDMPFQEEDPPEDGATTTDEKPPSSADAETQRAASADEADATDEDEASEASDVTEAGGDGAVPPKERTNDDSAEPAPIPTEEASANGSSAHEAASDDEGSDPLVLLVEDNEHNYNMLRRRLGRRGYEVIVATDGKEGLEEAEVRQPALILMDINLPVMNGKEATRRIRQFSEGGDVPIIALTAHAMSGDREEALEAGCDAYHSKPVELSKLLEQMEELLDGEAESRGG